MQFEKALNESFKRYKLHYIGTRKNYKIHDSHPYIVAVDEKYNPDDNGLSVLGLNLNYYLGDVNKLINDINSNDNEEGFRGFETKVRLKKFFNKGQDISSWEIDERKRRYDSLIKKFPYMAKFIRRYKITGPNSSGIKDQKRKII